MHASLRAFGMVTPNFHAPPKVFIILLNRISQLIRQYFTRQLVQVSLFANILPLQNFPTYGIVKKAPLDFIHGRLEISMSLFGYLR